MLIYFLQCSYYRRSASAKFATALFFLPPPASSGRPPDWCWGRSARYSPQADHQQWEHCPRLSKSGGDHCFDCLTRSQLLISSYSSLIAHLTDFLRGGKEKKRWIVYRRSDERSAEKAETKAFPNKRSFKMYFIKRVVRPRYLWVFSSSGIK